MRRLIIPRPVSAGLLLSYRCSGSCRHCLYACSPKWRADWLSPTDAEAILVQLAPGLQCDPQSAMGVNSGLHLTGGEPFLNFDLLEATLAIARRLGIRSTFVETNAFWCTDDHMVRERLLRLKHTGLVGILISANPFVVEHVPFARTRRAVRVSRELFGRNVMVYQQLFFQQFQDMGLEGTLTPEDYLSLYADWLQLAELLPGGRVSYALSSLFREQPVDRFLAASCCRELIRNWHVHVDNYGNYVPGYCAGIALGDARDLSSLCEEGIDLDKRPVLDALLAGMGKLLQLAEAHGYKARTGYISKCQLCLDMRRHLVRTGQFDELRPAELYEHLAD